MLNRKTIIWQMFGSYGYHPCCVVAMEVRHVSADVGVCLQAVKTLLENVHVAFPKLNRPTMLRSVSLVFHVLIPLHAGFSLENSAPQFTESKKGSYHSCRISLILLHTFAKCLITLSFSTSPGSQRAYCIRIQLITVIVLQPPKTCICPLPDI